MEINLLKSLYEMHKTLQLFNRYVHTKSIEPLLQKLPSNFIINVIGASVNNENIYSVTIGNGKKRVLFWSQMHGNESTTTKAMFDLFNVLNDKNSAITTILDSCTLCFIPILNPDGAKMYSRFNANNEDLNRDAQRLSQPESKVLRAVFDTFQPHYCFNLHGQRTLFSAGTQNKSASLSFLAPSQDIDRTITKTRQKAMEIIVIINKNLQQQIPGQVGVYNDNFNINCVGDTFQSLNVPTILFEAGHLKDDYSRDAVREYVFQSMLVGLHYIAENNITGTLYKPYFEIPNNENLFFDIIIRKAKVEIDKKRKILDIGIRYEEKLIENSVEFIPKIIKISDLNQFYGHKEIDANNYTVLGKNNKPLYEGYSNVFVMINNERVLLKT